MSLALIFSGQGMQHAGMLPWLARDDSVCAVADALGSDWRARLADPHWAGRNAHAQPLLVGLACAAWSQLAAHLPTPAVVAGYSVGELAAFAAAGVYGPATAIDLALRRAALMDREAGDAEAGLLAISGLAGPALEQLCGAAGLAIAIRNGLDSAVVGGPRVALAAATDTALRLGARCTPLINVNVASHTPWMAEAANGFARAISTLSFAAPRMTLLSNFSGGRVDQAQAHEALAAQIDHTVRWDECMEAIAARRVSCVLEIGPGQALARIWNERFAHVPARSADEFRSVAGIAAWVTRTIAP
ncbi:MULTISPECIES: acyltransferase domain-containing protein [Burkholderiales]|uniref:MdcH n=2 Tax=Burkholderiales TaxID=80840 RepID=Q6QHM9_ACHDE|nr:MULTISPECIES: acyltransferase domain-containing protein [Burkholderiales]AAK81663.1 malonate decarboxylase epsilon-subunit [Burkholderia cepacia]AAS49455.1 MdcH [Achromobacter denitrificans]